MQMSRKDNFLLNKEINMDVISKRISVVFDIQEDEDIKELARILNRDASWIIRSVIKLKMYELNNGELPSNLTDFLFKTDKQEKINAKR
jgi:hypothetical protein